MVVIAALVATSACTHTPPTPRNVHFDSAKAEPRDDNDFVVLGRALATMDGEPNMRLLIVGHTDSDGDAEANRKLAFSRANRVRELLVDQDPSLIHRLDLAFFGKDRPIAANDTEEGKAKNRRVELFFYFPEAGETNEVKLQKEFGGSLEFQASGSVAVN
jgi:outer membrane protein OmpA-like peptidoglycan-associated protein